MVNCDQSGLRHVVLVYTVQIQSIYNTLDNICLQNSVTGEYPLIVYIFRIHPGTVPLVVTAEVNI